MRIGELCERAGVTPRTVRYYESIGLMPPGHREGSGQHHYTDDAVARLRKIEQLKLLGLPLDEIGEVIDLYFAEPSAVPAKRKVLTAAKASDRGRRQDLGGSQAPDRLAASH